MAGGPEERETVLKRAAHNREDEVDQAARCQPRGRRGVARRVGVRVELKEIATGCRVDCADVLGSVHRCQLGIGRQPCRNASAELHQTLPLETGLDRREAARVLGVIVGSAVKEEALVEHEAGGHTGDVSGLRFHV